MPDYSDETIGDDLSVEEMTIRDGTIDMSLSGEAAKLFFAHLVQLMEQSGAKNFLTVDVKHGDKRYSITIQNCYGEDSPATKLNRMEKELTVKSTLFYLALEDINIFARCCATCSYWGHSLKKEEEPCKTCWLTKGMYRWHGYGKEERYAGQRENDPC